VASTSLPAERLGEGAARSAVRAAVNMAMAPVAIAPSI
jgi:hypothetical protein